jgi:competence protein ComEC
MKKKRSKRFSNLERIVWIILLITIIALCVNSFLDYNHIDLASFLDESTTDKPDETIGNNVEEPAIELPNSDSTLEVYFFDVGQADSILLRQGDSVMLVDTGNAGDADNSFKVLDKINLSHELQRLGITKIDYLVATHPHEDHMGSMYKIINIFDVKNVYANNILPEEEQAGYYKRFVSALENTDTHFISHTHLSEEEIKYKIAEYNSNVPESEKITYNPEDYFRVGDTINLGEAKATILAPNSADYSDTNDSSIVLMVEFQGNNILLTGDAGKASEKDILFYANKHGINLKSSVLKVAHHGSRTANTEEFISAVSPEYAIVMVGEGNSYDLPDEDVLERLERHGATIYMTKDVGDIKLIIKNGNISFDLDFTHEEKEAK